MARGEPTPESAAVRDVLICVSCWKTERRANVNFEQTNKPAFSGMFCLFVFNSKDGHLFGFLPFLCTLGSRGNPGSTVDTTWQLPAWYWCGEVIQVFKLKWITCGLSTAGFTLTRTTWRFSAYLCLDCLCACPLLIPSSPPASTGKQSIELLHAWLWEEGGEGKKTADYSETFSPVSSLKLNTSVWQAPVVKLEAEGLLWLSIASCVWMECNRNYIQSYSGQNHKIYNRLAAQHGFTYCLHDHSDRLDLREGKTFITKWFKSYYNHSLNGFFLYEVMV